MNKDRLESQLKKELYKIFKQEYYDEEEVDELGLFNIEFKENEIDNYTDVYIYAELSIEEFAKYQDKLNEIVERYDPSAYFDIINTGIYMSRIYDTKGNSSKKQIDRKESSVKIDDKYLKRFGIFVADEINDYLRTYECDYKHCYIGDDNTLILVVTIDGRHDWHYQTKLNPNKQYNAQNLISDFAQDAYDDLTSRMMKSI